MWTKILVHIGRVGLYRLYPQYIEDTIGWKWTSGDHRRWWFQPRHNQHRKQGLRVVLGRPMSLVKATTSAVIGGSCFPAEEAKNRKWQSWVGHQPIRQNWGRERTVKLKSPHVLANHWLIGIQGKHQDGRYSIRGQYVLKTYGMICLQQRKIQAILLSGKDVFDCIFLENIENIWKFTFRF